MNCSYGFADAASSALVSGSKLQPVSPARIVLSQGWARIQDYRKQRTVRLDVRIPGVFGVTALMPKTGRRTLDSLATVEVRLLDYPKRKILRTIAGHLSMVVHLVRLQHTRRNCAFGWEVQP